MLDMLEVLQMLDRTKHTKIANIESVDRRFINLRDNGSYDVLYIIRQIRDVVTIVHDCGNKDRTGVKIYTLWNRTDEERIKKLLSYGFSVNVVALIMNTDEENVWKVIGGNS